MRATSDLQNWTDAKATYEQSAARSDALAAETHAKARACPNPAEAVALKRVARGHEQDAEDARDLAASCIPHIKAAERAKDERDTLDEGRELQKRGAALMAEYPKVEAARAIIADFKASYEAFDRNLSLHNEKRRRVGDASEVVNGATIKRCKPGFEAISLPVPEGFVHPARALHDVRLPVVRKGQG